MTQKPVLMTQLETPPHGLTQVATYDRVVAASIERVWENVLDWEHLPWLHDGSFGDCQLHEAGQWGWRARLTPAGAGPDRAFELELLLQDPGDRYVSRTVSGGGAGTEIWTVLDPQGEHHTAVHVEFWVPGVAEGAAEALGKVFVTLYTRLWDEDESMMVLRQKQLDRRPRPRAQRQGLDLGRLDALRSRLPLDVEVDGLPFRVVARGEDLAVHATRCPHMLGPLAEAPGEPGTLRCPWHGYRFDAASGANCDGRRLRLEPAPEIRVDPCSARVELVWPELAPSRPLAGSRR